MENSVFRISLDVHQQTTQAHLAVKKGDTARTIIASLSDGGKPYKIEDGCSATFMAQKPDGNVLYNACRIENNRIVYDFTEQTVSAAGRMICELRLYGADDKVITSPKIAIIVSGTVYEDDEVESTSEFTALSQAMADVAELKKTGLKGDPGDNVELRYADHQVVWRYVMPEGEPEDEWKVLFSSDEVRDQMVQETLNQARGYAEAAAESAELANEIATSAQGYCSQVYNDCLGVKSSAEQSAQQAKEAVAAVPKALPNPQKLVLTGAVKAEYDGSENVEVSIPAGSGVHVGADSPMNGEKFWYNPDEEPEGGGTVSPEAIKQALGEYMVEHPETDPTVPTWAKQPEKPTYTAAEVGALPADTPIPEGVTDEQIKDVVDAYLTENPVESSGSKWRLIGDVMTTEAVSTVEVYGETPLNEMLVFTSVPAINEDPGGTAYYKVKMMSENGTLSDMITGILVTKPYTRDAIRHIFRVDALGGSAQKWDASTASPPSYIGFTQDAALGIRDAHLNGYVLVGFQICWNLKYTLPAGVHIQVWGR